MPPSHAADGSGGSRGIGAAMARAFAAAGYAVAVNYHRSEAEARALVEELSSSGYSGPNSLIASSMSSLSLSLK